MALKPVTVQLPPWLIAHATVRARVAGMSLSTYLRWMLVNETRRATELHPVADPPAEQVGRRKSPG